MKKIEKLKNIIDLITVYLECLGIGMFVICILNLPVWGAIIISVVVIGLFEIIKSNALMEFYQDFFYGNKR